MLSNFFDKQFNSDTSWAFVCRVMGIVLAVAVNAIITRLLSSEDVGRYFLVISGCWAISLIIMWGLNQSLVRLSVEQLAEKKVTPPPVISAGLILVLILWILLFSFSFLPSSRIAINKILENEYNSRDILIFSLWALLLSLQSMAIEALRGSQKIIRASIFGMLQSSFFFLLTIALMLAKIQVDVRGLILAQAGIALLNLISIVLFNKKTFLPFAPPVFSEIKQLLIFSSPFFITSIILYFSTQADLWIVGLYLHNADVAIYGLALRVTLLLPFILGVVNSTLQPQITEFYKKNNIIKLESKLRMTASIAWAPAFFIYLMSLAVGSSAFATAFGVSFANSFDVFKILAIGYLIHIWVGSPGYVLLMTKHQVGFLVVVAVSTLLSIGLSILLVNKFGLLGVACGSAIGLAAQSLLAWIFVKLRVGIWTHATIKFKLKEV